MKKHFLIVLALIVAVLSFASCGSVVLPGSVTSMGYGVFNGCSSLTSIVIPAGVMSIGVYSLSGCSSLTSVQFSGTTAQWKAITFSMFRNKNTGNYTVICTDGTVAKDGTVTLN